MFEAEQKKMYDIFHVGLESMGRICGGIPKHPDMLVGWIKRQNKDLTDEERKKFVEAEREKLGELVDEKAEKSWTGFRTDDKGNAFIGSYQVKAMFKELAKTLDFNQELKKESFKHDMQTAVHIKPLVISFGKKADGHEEKCIHVTGPGGPRSAIKRFDYMESGSKVGFDVWVLKKSVVTEDHVKQILILGQEAGLGSNRSQGYGTYAITKFDKEGTSKKKK